MSASHPTPPDLTRPHPTSSHPTPPHHPTPTSLPTPLHPTSPYPSPPYPSPPYPSPPLLIPPPAHPIQSHPASPPRRYEMKDGRMYYYHADNGQTTWVEPPEFAAQLSSLEATVYRSYRVDLTRSHPVHSPHHAISPRPTHTAPPRDVASLAAPPNPLDPNSTQLYFSPHHPVPRQSGPRWRRNTISNPPSAKWRRQQRSLSIPPAS